VHITGPRIVSGVNRPAARSGVPSGRPATAAKPRRAHAVTLTLSIVPRYGRATRTNTQRGTLGELCGHLSAEPPERRGSPASPQRLAILFARHAVEDRGPAPEAKTGGRATLLGRRSFDSDSPACRARRARSRPGPATAITAQPPGQRGARRRACRHAAAPVRVLME
jgi:hypothetical protein